MAKTRSGTKMHNLCNNVPSKNKKKTKNYSATDEQNYVNLICHQ